MNIRTALATVVAGFVAVAGLASPAAAAPPTVATPYPQSGMSNFGACGGIAVGSYKVAGSPGVGATRNPGPLTLALKGAPSTKDQLAKGQVGSCLLSPALGVTSTVPAVLKFTMKLTSSAWDCKYQETAATEKPLQGKVTWTFDTDADGTADSKIDGYTRFVGLDSVNKDLMWVTGLVTKGDAAGATIGGNLWYMVAFKSTLAVGTYQSPNFWKDFAPNGQTDQVYSIAPGYAYSAKWNTANGNCGQFGPVIQGLPNVTDIAFGALSTSQFGFGHASAGWVFLV